MFMDGWDWMASVAMLMLLIILLMLLVQYLQTNKAWRLLEHWHSTTKERQQRVSWHAEENRELKSALRAEKAHVEQLQRKVEILQALLP
jgi:cell division protein FtsB